MGRPASPSSRRLRVRPTRLPTRGRPGCALSGDIGFFRFMGAKLPKSPKKAVALHGRACGTGVVTGTAVRTADDTFINVAATFV